MRNQPRFLHKIIDLSGSPYEIGFQRGKMFKDVLRKDMEKLTTFKGTSTFQTRPADGFTRKTQRKTIIPRS